MPFTTNPINQTAIVCNEIWSSLGQTNGVHVVYLLDGTIFAELPNGDGTYTPYNINKKCCDILKTKLVTNNQTTLNGASPNDIYFDLNQQKCRWSSATIEPCDITENSSIKVVLNPEGNDGTLFTYGNDEICRLDISFDFLVKFDCSKQSKFVTSTGKSASDPELKKLRQNKFELESNMLDLDNKINGLILEDVNTNYSIVCNEFPINVNENEKTTDSVISLTEKEKSVFSDSGFGSLVTPTSIISKSKPIYDTKSVTFCLTDAGLIMWQKIINDVNYSNFIKGDPNSYTCDNVMEIYKLNDDAIINNKDILLYECTTPFGYKTEIMKNIDTLVDKKRPLLSDVNTIDQRILVIESETNICDTLLGQFQNIKLSVTLDTLNNDGSITGPPKYFIEPIFGGFDTASQLYNYLENHPNDSGFLLCGDNSSGCTPMVISEYTGVTESSPINSNSCEFIKNTLITQLSNAGSGTLSPNIFNSEWKTFSDSITDLSILSGITGHKIKLNIIVNNSCGDFCILVDNINIIRVCDDINRTNIFVGQSPGFNLTKVIDNKKSWLQSDSYINREFYIGRYDDTNKIRQTEYSVDEERLVLNSKEVDLNMNMASAVENDVWCYLSDYPNLLSGFCTDITNICCDPCLIDGEKCCGDNGIIISALTTTDVKKATTLETFEDILTSELTDVKNRKILSAYPTLKAVYDRYMNATQYGVPQSNEFTYQKMDEFTGLIKNYWDDLIEQVVPATTLWGSVKVYTNTMFDQQKFKYKSYTSLFCDEPENVFSVPFNVPSPINGTSGQCQSIEVILNYISNEESDRPTEPNVYNKICLSQMNYGSEFIGNVDIMGPNGQYINNDSFCMPAPLCSNCVDGTVTIGTQIWDKCNANVATYSDGEPIPQVTDPVAWAALTTGAWCYYDNDPATEATYGKIYNWYAVAGIWDEESKTNPSARKSLAPVGKRMPTDNDWTILTNELGGEFVAGGKMKETGFCHWKEPNTGANNESGFTGLPGGNRTGIGIFDFIGRNGGWWSSSQINASGGFIRTLFYGSNNIDRPSFGSGKEDGFSVRFLTITDTCPICVDESVIIGGQIWDKCNLSVAVYSDNTPIPEVTDPIAWSALTTGAWCYYDNDPANEASYGKLYNWYAVAGIYDAASLANPALRKSLVPDGKFMPSDNDWDILINELGGESVAGGKMKEEGTFCNWVEPNSGATNDSGFTARGGGNRAPSTGEFSLIGIEGTWWSSTENVSDPTQVWGRILNTGDGIALRGDGLKRSGVSVRCLRTPPSPCSNCVVSTVTIGSQIWDKCNLNVTTYSDGEPIPQVTGATEWAALTTGAWRYHNNDPANEATYGKLYNWYAVAGIWDEESKTNPSARKSLAPVGKHVPTKDEFTTLIASAGGIGPANGALKETGTCNWDEPNDNANNSTGWTGLPGGIGLNNGNSIGLGAVGIWWSTTSIGSPPSQASTLRLFAGNTNVSTSNWNVRSGLSVRCIND